MQNDKLSGQDVDVTVKKRRKEKKKKTEKHL